MAKAHKNPLLNLHGAQVPKSSRQIRREAPRPKDWMSLRTEKVEIGVDPAGGDDQTGVLVIDSLPQSALTGRIFNDSTRAAMRDALTRPLSWAARNMAGMAPRQRGVFQLIAGDDMPTPAAAPPHPLTLLFGTGRHQERIQVGRDFVDLERHVVARHFASMPIVNYQIQAGSAAMEAFFQTAQDLSPNAESFEDAVRLAVAAMDLPTIANNLPKSRAKERKPDHPDTGKVVRQPARSYCGLLIEEVRQADGSVARRIRTNPPK